MQTRELGAVTDMELNLALLIVGTLIALTGFAGKKVKEPDPEHPPLEPLIRRIRPLGWAFLVLTVIGLSLGVYKEATSLDGRLRSVYPDFGDLVRAETGHSQKDWSMYMSYRISLRFIIQHLYRKVIGPPGPSASMESMLRELGQRGAINDDICRRLDFIRWNTFAVEWGVVEGPSPTKLATVQADVNDALRSLSDLSKRIDVKALQPNVNSVCGKKPEDWS